MEAEEDDFKKRRRCLQYELQYENYRGAQCPFQFQAYGLSFFRESVFTVDVSLRSGCGPSKLDAHWETQEYPGSLLIFTIHPFHCYSQGV